jgi:hypothetical protein
MDDNVAHRRTLWSHGQMMFVVAVALPTVAASPAGILAAAPALPNETLINQFRQGTLSRILARVHSG